MPESLATRPRRSDARRNSDVLVAAAKEVFADLGVDAPTRTIAERAGVGVGTLYRNFPKRSDLIIAVVAKEIDDCVQAAEDLGRNCAPWEAVEVWTGRYTAFVATKMGLAAALHSGDAAYDGLAERFRRRLEPAFQQLLDRAAEAGDLRGPVVAREVLVSLSLLCQAVAGEASDFNQRMVAVFVAGLRAPAQPT